MINVSEILTAIKPYVLGWIGMPVSYTPTWTAASVNPTLGNGTLTGSYTRRGNLCLFTFCLTIGSTTNKGTGAWAFSLPFTAATGWSRLGVAQLRDAGTNSYPRMAQITSGGTTLSIFLQLDNATNVNTIDTTTPFTWGDTDSLTVQIEYEVA